MEGRPELRRTLTLSDQLSAAAPDLALRDFLKIRDDDDGDGEDQRTLMEMIRDQGADGGENHDAGVNWKPLKDRLRLRRAGSAWPTPHSSSSAAAAGGGDGGGDATDAGARAPAPAFGRSISRTVSIRQGPSTAAFSRGTSTRRADTVSASAEEGEDEEEEEEPSPGAAAEGEAPVMRMSLMALLEQTDSQWNDGEDGGGGGGGGLYEDDEDEEEEEEAADGGGTGGMFHVCCVCMVRHKGAAFIPCGHTFCRLCSRELWVSRGNCPLCNGFIQEILDIF